MPRALLVDLGGTNTRVATLSARGRLGEPVYFASNELPGLAAALAAVHRDERVLVVALAGPVHGARAQLTNVAYAVDAVALGKTFGFERVVLVNDLLAHGLGLLTRQSFRAIGGGRVSLARGPVAVVAAGTGLGEAVFERGPTGVLWGRASEGGHGPFAPVFPIQMQYARFLAEEIGRPASAEDALAGRGLGALYRFFLRQGAREAAARRRAIEGAADPNEAVVRAALDKTSAVATRALYTYVAAFGAELRAVVLKHSAFGGVVLAGGLASSLRAHWTTLGLRTSFAGTGPFTEQLAELPIAVADDTGSALEGAAVLARDPEALHTSQYGLFVWNAAR